MQRSTSGISMAATISYILVAAAAARGIFQYPDVRGVLLLLIAVQGVAIAAERLLAPERLFRRLALIMLQAGVMTALFFVAPLVDPWALMMLPACLGVMQSYKPAVGWGFVAFFSVVMSVMIMRAETPVDAPAYIIIYIPAYLLVASSSLSLRRAHEARRESETLVERLTEAHARVREYASRVEDLTSARERSRIARDLHDTVTQTVFSITLMSRSARMVAAVDAKKAAEHLAEIEALANSALKESRELIYELRPVLISEVGLLKALRHFVSEAGKTGGLGIRIDADTPEPDLSLEAKRHIFAVVQEAVNNVRKHADARNVKISLHSDLENHVFETIVEDDGTGFDVKLTLPKPGHLGLVSMRERAEEMHADLKIKSANGSGTMVRLLVPMGDDR